MRLLLAGGGTGGHLFPAVALGDMLIKQHPESSVLFVGTRRGLEYRLLPKLDLPLETVDMVGVVGRGWRGKVEMIPRLLTSMGQVRRIMAQFRPDLVVGFGGYASVPVLLMARFKGIPYLIHEQNAIPGLANRVAARGAALVCVSYPETRSAFPQNRTKVTGNPLRSGLEQVPEMIREDGTLLVFGGSRGARAINDAMVGCLEELMSWPRPPAIVHQTGDEDFQRIEAAYAACAYPDATVVPFIDDMAAAYRDARLIVCRAGATTLAELTVCGRPAILIPFPHAAGDHQSANARALEKAGAAVVLNQRDLTPMHLATEIKILFEDSKQLQQMGARGRLIGVPDATRLLLDECLSVVSAAY